MIALSSAVFLIGLSDLLQSRDLADRAARGYFPEELPRRLVLLLAAIAVLAITAVHSPWWATVCSALASSLWICTYGARPAPAMLLGGILLAGLALQPILQLLPWWNSVSDPLDPHWRAYEWGLTIAAVALVNIATANRIVRAVLRFSDGASTQDQTSISPTKAGTPRAGRLIGVLERYLLIVLAVGGYAAAIAGLAAAKSIIRYPEISQSGKGKIGLSAEVFFIGTVTSWLCALASVGLLLLAF